MRVKNEARWIRSVLHAALQVCEWVYVLDDHSTDETAEICRSVGERLRVFQSPFDTLNEARDKNWLLDTIRQTVDEADWVLSIDGDELLMDPFELIVTVESGRADCYALRVLYLWDRHDQVRTDGVYGRFWRPSLFRLRPQINTKIDSFHATANGGNFHCGNVPHGFAAHAQRTEIRLLHFGYLDASDRRRKFDWYNKNDPNNMAEDHYQHIIQGDRGGPPARMPLKHAGPLALEALNPWPALSLSQSL